MGDDVTAGRTGVLAAVVLAAGIALGGAAARAEGYQPFYGYSDYFGGPTTYFTPDTDVQQVTRPEGGYFGLGTRTYYRGGPFWAYKPSGASRSSYGRERHRGSRRRTVLHSKG